MPSNVKTVAVLTAHPGKSSDLRALLVALTVPSRLEPGNLRYDLWIDQREAGRFVLDELYFDAALAAHRASPHFQDYLSRINDLAERSSFSLDPVSVA
jgi:quinol monooxygenase YgiN